MKYWDKAWSLIEGCTPVSPACENCWLASIEHRFRPDVGATLPPQLTNTDGNFNGKIIIRPDRLDIPLKRKKPTVYAIWSDLFHESVPDKFIIDAFTTMSIAKRHIFLILTKRSCRTLEWINNRAYKDVKPFENIWIGTTVENQEQADKRIPLLLQIPGKKFLSIEPMLGEIDLTNIHYRKTLYPDGPNSKNLKCEININVLTGFCDDGWDTWFDNKIDWVVVGAESGRKRRECKIEWIESIVDQCKEAGVPVFVKQIHKDGKLVTDINYFPKSLRIRELPWEKGG